MNHTRWCLPWGEKKDCTSQTITETYFSKVLSDSSKNFKTSTSWLCSRKKHSEIGSGSVPTTGVAGTGGSSCVEGGKGFIFNSHRIETTKERV